MQSATERPSGADEVPGTSSHRPAGSAGAWRRRTLLAAALVAAAAAVWLLAGKRPAKKAEAPPAIVADERGLSIAPDAPQWRYVELATAQEAAALPLLPSPGRVTFDEQRTSAVGTPLAGRVERVLVRIGDQVDRGARLFSVRSGAWAELDNQVSAARAAVLVKQRLAERARELVAIKAAPEKDQLAAEAELNQAELALAAATAKLDSLRVSAEGNNLFWVLATRRGTVVEADVYASQEVTPDREKPLLRISDLDEVLVLADVQERDATDIGPRAKAEVRIQAGGLRRAGSVERVSEVVDPTRRTVEVRIRVENRDRAFRPNGFAEVVFDVAPGSRRIRVPSAAVVTDGERSVVFVSPAPGRLERAVVQPGRQRDGEVEIVAGLQPGVRYVSRGALLLLNQVELSK